MRWKTLIQILFAICLPTKPAWPAPTSSFQPSILSLLLNYVECSANHHMLIQQPYFPQPIKTDTSMTAYLIFQWKALLTLLQFHLSYLIQWKSENVLTWPRIWWTETCLAGCLEASMRSFGLPHLAPPLWPVACLSCSNNTSFITLQ